MWKNGMAVSFWDLYLDFRNEKLYWDVEMIYE